MILDSPAAPRSAGPAAADPRFEAGKIDAIVCYRVDRLTRALTDFTRLVEIFDRHSVSLVTSPRVSTQPPR